MSGARLRVTDEDGVSWEDPSEQQIQRLYAGLNLRRRFLVLERLDVPPSESGEHYLQVRLNDDLTVEIEYRDGSAAAHYRAGVDVPSDQGGSEIVEPVLLGWAAERADWRARLPWTRWDVMRECPWDENSTIDEE
ncbi:hypothetical protein OIE73_23185 [Streptomyces hirsutus]|uniref:CYTH domain-containing protein n=1 Tax=Streptomyces hirsutus TaxID=35620 RepID=A0ABZ1GSE4_9ACTN|nr:hypothetical protein [Streptomyces hirsutus]WSD08343.1 hypothetical protein OIE73_23185 [Streptomyces hirsutus]